MSEAIKAEREKLSKSISQASKPINVAELKPISRLKRFKVLEDEGSELIIWKIYEDSKIYKGEVLGVVPTFEVSDHTGETFVIQSNSPSSWALFEEWDDRKAPCPVYVWKNTEGSKTMIQWAYKD